MKSTQDIYIDAARRALARAYANHAHDYLSAIEADDSGAIALYRKDDSVYVVTLAECGCKGSQIGRHLCFHQLALADRVGMLDRFLPGIYGEGSPLAAGCTLRTADGAILTRVDSIDRITGAIAVTSFFARAPHIKSGMRAGIAKLEHYERALALGTMEVMA